MSHTSKPSSLQLKLLFTITLLFGIALSWYRPALADDWHSFKSAPVDSSKSQTIRGSISKPEGNGPFPAVIIAHGCFGVEKNQFDWAKRMNAWGYATLILDSFGTRDVQEICSDPKKVSPITRACDVFGAAAYLRSQTYVNPGKIGLIGFSHGGWAALQAAQENFAAKARQKPLQAVVAYYPWCPRFGLKNLSVPLLLLIGKADDWTPMDQCTKLLNKQNKGHEKHATLVSFDNSFHGFDDPSMKSSKQFDGHTIAFNESAATISIEKTKAFFARFLNP